jgi:Tol biopolymer transport system component
VGAPARAASILRALVALTGFAAVAIAAGCGAPAGKSGAAACPEASATSSTEPSNDGPEFSPRGTSIAFESNRSGSSQIYVLTLAGCKVRQVTRGSAWAINPTWSPDGKRIAFQRMDPGSVSSRIYVVNAGGTKLRRVTRAPVGEREPSTDWFPAWSPDGRTIAFDRDESSELEGTERRNIYVVNVDGTGLERLTSGPFNVGPSWSRSGAWIAWARESDIYRMRPDGSGKTRVTTSPPQWNGDTAPSWSPDGKAIVFERSSPSVGLILYVTNLRGAARELTDGSDGNDSSPDWSPDGRTIVFRRSGGSDLKESADLYLIEPDGSGLRRLTRTS